MAWSIFRQGGGEGAAVTWAQNLLSAIGAPQTPGNIQFIYDWEKSEGGGGKYNPLNQGPVGGHPELTTSGSQFGGGAADFASWQAGIQGTVDFLHYPRYSGILNGLLTNNPESARAALIASPWAASHYNHGAGFSNAPLPGKATALSGATPTSANLTSVPAIGGASIASSITSPIIQTILAAFGINDLKDLVQRAALILLGTSLLLIGIFKFTDPGKAVIEKIVIEPKEAAEATAASGGATKTTAVVA